MNSIIKNILCFLLLISYISASNKFYETCLMGTSRTYAVDYSAGTCIEFCIYQRQYWFYKTLETELAYAFNDTPCESLGFTKFEGFEIRSYLGLGTYIDKYKK